MRNFKKITPKPPERSRLPPLPPPALPKKPLFLENIIKKKPLLLSSTCKSNLNLHLSNTHETQILSLCRKNYI